MVRRGGVFVMGKKTVLGAGMVSTDKYLRTAVPSFIVEQFGLRVGDSLDWELQVVDGVLCVVVVPLKKEVV